MNQQMGLRWKIYLFIFALAALGNLAALLDEGSVISTYYFTLIAFDSRYFAPYALNIASAAINAAAIIPLFLYVLRIRFLGMKFWQVFFAVRVLSDLTGHAYEVNFVKSIFYSNLTYGVSAVALLILFTIPSYLALFRYAFRQKSVLEK